MPRCWCRMLDNTIAPTSEAQTGAVVGPGRLHGAPARRSPKASTQRCDSALPRRTTSSGTSATPRRRSGRAATTTTSSPAAPLGHGCPPSTWKGSSIYLDRRLRGLDALAIDASVTGTVASTPCRSSRTMRRGRGWTSTCGALPRCRSWTNGAQEALKAQAIRHAYVCSKEGRRRAAADARRPELHGLCQGAERTKGFTRQCRAQPAMARRSRRDLGPGRDLVVDRCADRHALHRRSVARATTSVSSGGRDAPSCGRSTTPRGSWHRATRPRTGRGPGSFSGHLASKLGYEHQRHLGARPRIDCARSLGSRSRAPPWRGRRDDAASKAGTYGPRSPACSPGFEITTSTIGGSGAVRSWATGTGRHR
jgi:hypothetical protein